MECEVSDNGKDLMNGPKTDKGLVDPVTQARIERAQIQAKESADRQAQEDLWFVIKWAIFALVGLGISMVIWDALSSFLFGRQTPGN
jgi:hypothetical protein